MGQWFRLCLAGVCALTASGADLDDIGVIQLRSLVPSLTGSGIKVAQPEAGSPNWQVNPTAVGQSPDLFTWTSASGTATNFPNGLGSESAHASEVGSRFYGPASGVAPGVTAIQNFEAGYFLGNLVRFQSAIAAQVVNQSFVDSGQVPSEDAYYDNYTARYGTLFASGVGNSGAPSSPSTAFNSIAVGCRDGGSSAGPTMDGRCKPDLVAPGTYTSFTTPLVSGCAALLCQAAARNDAGPGTASLATNAIALKALLLNGADKPVGWTNLVTQPLDYRFGAGIVNVLNAYRQLRGGRHSPTVQTSNPTGGTHPPPVQTNNVPARRGWDLASLSSTPNADRVNHYFFDLRATTNRAFVLTATLVWNRQANRSGINDLNLFLYNADTGDLLSSSASSLDNVEHLFVWDVSSARYDLQVLKRGGNSPERITDSETYALAFEFGPPATAELTQASAAQGQFQARLLAEPYLTYVIERTANLSAWQPVVTNTVGGVGYFDFTSGIGSSPSQFFYRSRWAP